MTLIVNYIIEYGLYIYIYIYIYICVCVCVCVCVFVSGRIRSDIRTFGSDRIRVSDRIRLNPYPFKKIGFYPYPYPLSSQRIFLLFDRIESDRIGNPRIRTYLPSLLRPPCEI